MRKLKSLKEFKVEKSALKNIKGGIGANMSMEHWGAVATCVNNRDDTASWHRRDNLLTGEVGIAYWG